ncbi:1133_t:CDS:2 [Paraglomus occultum]|nr:1133_t:CDS:2 [Paraglomus occultum]
MSTVNLWDELCNEIPVEGDVIYDEHKIQITGRKTHIEDAKKRLRVLETISLRRHRHLGMSLLHYPDKTVWFKASFLHLNKHDYFKRVVRNVGKKAFVLVAAVQNPANEKQFLTNKSATSSTQQRNSSGYPFPSRQQSASRQSSTSTQSSAFLKSPASPTSQSSPQSYGYPQSSLYSQSSAFRQPPAYQSSSSSQPHVYPQSSVYSQSAASRQSSAFLKSPASPASQSSSSPSYVYPQSSVYSQSSSSRQLSASRPSSSVYPQPSSSVYPQPSSSVYPQPSSSVYPQSSSSVYPQSSSSVYPQSSSSQLSAYSPSFHPRIEAGIRLTEEEKLARKQAKKQQLAEMRKMRALGITKDENGAVSGSSRLLPGDNHFEGFNTYETKTTADTLDERSTDSSSSIIPNITTENDEKPLPGQLLREFNFDQMKNIFSEALDYVHPLKGEIRFFGSLGKSVFQDVPSDVGRQLWEYFEVDGLKSRYKMKHTFHNAAAYDDDHKLIDYLAEVCGEFHSRSEHFEINAKARNAQHDDFEDIVMSIDINNVLLKWVAYPWARVADVDWSILERKFDVQFTMAKRRSIRSDIKPFNMFIKKVSITPSTNRISFEDIPELLKVKSIYRKTTRKFKLHKPFMAEFSRIEKVPIQNQQFQKRLGKTGEGKIHYTIEIINRENKSRFKENIHLGVGELPTWTKKDILGEEPGLDKLVELIKTMLLLVEKTDKAAEKWFAELDVQNNSK